jgi:hypothetical protein
LLTDVTKKDYLAANWFVFGAPLKEKIEAAAPQAVAMGRKYALYSALRNGATTVLDPGGGPGALDDYVAIVGQTGGRVFFSPPFRSHDISTDTEGRHYYEERADKGRPGLKAAVDFIKKFHGAHNSRLQGILNPSHTLASKHQDTPTYSNYQQVTQSLSLSFTLTARQFGYTVGYTSVTMPCGSHLTLR